MRTQNSGNELFSRVNGRKVDAPLHQKILDNPTAASFARAQSIDFLMETLGYSHADASAFYMRGQASGTEEENQG